MKGQNSIKVKGTDKTDKIKTTQWLWWKIKEKEREKKKNKMTDEPHS